MGPQRNRKELVQAPHGMPAWFRPAPIALAISLAFAGLGPASALGSPASALPPVATQTDGAPRTRHEIVFVNPAVPDYRRLLQDFSPGIETIVLSPDRDGAVQMAEAVRLRSGLGAIHVLSHGASGQLQLGNTQLNGGNLASHADALRQIGRSLAAGGDILLYGCEVGAGSKGAAFIDRLAKATGVDVAALTNRTGIGSDWDLEISTGHIEAMTPFGLAALAAYPYDLATITVTSSADSGAGSLRNAISVAAASDTITFNSGMTITLSSGELVINKNLTIDGDLDRNGTPDVTVDANHTSRVFNITAGTVTLDGLTITHGLLFGHGGNGAHGSGISGISSLGAGIANAGILSIVDSAVSGNVATGGGGGGGGAVFSTGFGGGGGSGYSGTGGGYGGRGYVAVGAMGSGGSGGGGGGYHNNASGATGGSYTGVRVGGNGGTSAGGGAGGAGMHSGGNGGSVTGGGGGGGGAGYYGYSPSGGSGGVAAGGISNTGTLYIANTVFSGNKGAGGGGGGSAGTGGLGGMGVGALYNQGTLYYNAATTTFTGDQGAGGGAGNGGGAATGTNDIQGPIAGSNWDNTAPTVTSVSGPANATYIAGQNLDFSVNFDEAVIVTGTPYLSVTLDTGGPVQAAYISGSGTSTLTFRYTVASGNLDTNGVVLGGSITANGGTLKDAAGNNATLTLNNVPSTAGVLVDAVAPTVQSVTLVGTPAGNSTSIQYAVTFSEAVTGVDSSDFTLTATGGAAGSIASVSGSGSSYTVTVNSITGAGTLRLDLKASGTGIADIATNPIASGYTGGAVFTVDTVAPSITSVSAPASATYIAGQNLDFTVNFDEAVTVNTGSGTPSLALTLDTGGTVQATYISGSGTSALTFRYTVAPGHLDSTGIALGSSIALNGGTLKDSAGNDATLTLNSVASTVGVLVDAVAPTVTSVSAPANGTYKATQNLDFTVNFSEAVTVNTGGGTPSLSVTLDTGGPVQAAYISGSGTSTLTFRYTVASGNLDTNGVVLGGSITANGGTLKDAAGNNATLTLNNVPSTAGVLVDAVAPTVQSVTLVGTPAGNSTSIQYAVTFSEAVTGVDSSDFTLTATGGAAGSIASVSGSGSSYTVTVNSITGAGTLRLDLKASGTGIADIATNPIATGYAGGAVFTVDTVPPTLPAANIVVNNQADPHAVALTFSEALDAATLGAANTWIVTANGGSPAYTVVGVGLSGGNVVTLTLATVNMTDDKTHILDADATAHLKVTPPASLKDVAGNSYVAGVVTESGAIPVLDNTPPTLSGVATSAPTSNGGTLNATASEKAMGYWIAVAQGATAPTVAQVKAGANYGGVTVVAHGSGVLPAASAGSFTLSGLSVATTYDIYLMADDAAGNSSAAASIASLMTSTSVVTTYSGPSATGTGTITASFTGGGPGCGYSTSQFVAVSSVGTPPPDGVSFPQGLFYFTTTGCTPGSTLSFTITYPQALSAGDVYWKFGPTPDNASPHWYVLPATIADNTATFSITDGQLGDDDRTVNGAVVDAGGPGSAAIATGIPALGNWALTLLAAVMGALGMKGARRRR